MRYWQASRVSAVLAVTPLLTVAFGSLLAALPTGYVNEDRVDALSLAGAVLVVFGSAVCALGGGRPRALN
jgi:drug/metabolite transporter (DMT)-like permease